MYVDSLRSSISSASGGPCRRWSPNRNERSIATCETIPTLDSVLPRLRAALSTACLEVPASGGTGFHKKATRETRGAASFKSSRFFPMISGSASLASPVMFPPGRARLAMKFALHGIPRDRHDDRDGRGRLLDSSDHWVRPCHEDVDLQLNKLRRKSGACLASPPQTAAQTRHSVPRHTQALAGPRSAPG